MQNLKADIQNGEILPVNPRLTSVDLQTLATMMYTT